MARIRTDSDRANLLRSLLPDDSDDGYPSTNPAAVGSFPQSDSARRKGERDTIKDNLGPKRDRFKDIPPDAGEDDPSEMPDDGPNQFDGPPQEKFGGAMSSNQPMQPVPGQPGMVAVPAQLAQSVMQMLMKQGSNNAIGKSAGADGTARPPVTEEEEEV